MKDDETVEEEEGLMKIPGEIVRFDAGHTPSGNPRRVFVWFSAGCIVRSYDEGYRGTRALPEELRSKWLGITIKTTPTTYRELLRHS